MEITIWFSIRIENSHIHEDLLKRDPQNPLALMSDLASSCLFAVLYYNTSPVSGCMWGSMRASWHTLSRKDAVRSRTSLCLRMGNPPLRQFKAWWTLNGFLYSHLIGTPSGASHIWGPQHCKNGTYGERSHKLLKGQWTARKMHLPGWLLRSDVEAWVRGAPQFYSRFLQLPKNTRNDCTTIKSYGQ